MARRAIIRSRSIGTDVAQIEEMLHADYKAIWKQHQQDMDLMADVIWDQAILIVPLDTGKLRNSIKVHFSRSRRYPFIIATASAFDPECGYDYALIQEEVEEPTYKHNPGRMAHYLGGPFAREVSIWYKNITGKEMDLPKNLKSAIEYIEKRGG